MKKSNEIDQYIAGFPGDIQILLEKVRATILKAAPGAEEVISYKMPAYKLSGILVWYAGYKNHIGFYPTPGPIKLFKDDIKGYKTSKGAIQFPIDKPLPIGLITKIVKFRAKEVLMKLKAKTKKI
jgi:uncharacterized protein YdhG (YjbR/CyaY superfamily)